MPTWIQEPNCEVAELAGGGGGSRDGRGQMPLTTVMGDVVWYVGPGLVIY